MPAKTLKESAVNNDSCNAVAPDSYSTTGTNEKKMNCVMQ